MCNRVTNHGDMSTFSKPVRVGHVGFNGLGAPAYLPRYLDKARFNMKDSNLCLECKVPETIDHFILRCPIYTEERAKLVQRLRKSHIFVLTLKILLEGSPKHY